MYTCLNSLPELCRTATSVSRSSAQTASPQQTVWGFWGSWGGRNCCYWTWGRLRTGGRGPPSGAGGTGSWWGVRVSGGDRPVYGSGLWSQSSQAMEQIERLVIKANTETMEKAGIRCSFHEPSFIHQWRLHNFSSFLQISDTILASTEFYILVVDSVYSSRESL